MAGDAKFTPAPWPIESARTLLSTDDPRRTLADPQAEANARLIAAAPDLYAQLKTALDHIEHMAKWIGERNAGARGNYGVYSFESLGEDMPGMREALAKARGAQ